MHLHLIYSVSKELEAMTICTDMHAHATYMMLKTIWDSVKHNVSWRTLNTSYKQFFNDRQRDIAINFLSWSTVKFTKSMDVVFNVCFTQQQTDLQHTSKYMQAAAAKFDQADWSEDEIRQTIGNLIIMHLADLASVSGQLSKPEKHAFIHDIKKNGIEHAAVELMNMLHGLESSYMMTYNKAVAIAFIIAGYDVSIWTDAEIESLQGSPLNIIEYEMLNSAMTALDDISAEYYKQQSALRAEFDRKIQALRDEEVSKKDNVCSQIDKALSKNLSGSSAKAMIIDILSG